MGVDVRIGLWQGQRQHEITIHGNKNRRGSGHTSCFFSSTLSCIASLAAVRRVLALASVWPFAISAVRVSAGLGK